MSRHENEASKIIRHLSKMSNIFLLTFDFMLKVAFLYSLRAKLFD